MLTIDQMINDLHYVKNEKHRFEIQLRATLLLMWGKITKEQYCKCF